MKNSEFMFEDDLIMHLLGAADLEKYGDAESYIKSSIGDERKSISEFYELLSLLTKLTLGRKSVPELQANVKSRLFEKLKEKRSGDSDIHNHDFEFIYSDSQDWQQHPVEGIEVKLLSQNLKKGYSMLLMKVKAGVEFPSHVHHGAEECFVIEGDVIAEGKILGPGDFHHAEAGSRHGALSTKNGCTLLLVVDNLDL
ncbi:MAG: hypothetical protein HGGPFJEG_02747 [Ignavibacteria bacterium]|nr:hypothetical protein [Ignavibacteria bacterium]